MGVITAAANRSRRSVAEALELLIMRRHAVHEQCRAWMREQPSCHDVVRITSLQCVATQSLCEAFDMAARDAQARGRSVHLGPLEAPAFLRLPNQLVRHLRRSRADGEPPRDGIVLVCAALFRAAPCRCKSLSRARGARARARARVSGRSRRRRRDGACGLLRLRVPQGSPAPDLLVPTDDRAPDRRAPVGRRMRPLKASQLIGDVAPAARLPAHSS